MPNMSSVSEKKQAAAAVLTFILAHSLFLSVKVVQSFDLKGFKVSFNTRTYVRTKEQGEMCTRDAAVQRVRFTSESLAFFANTHTHSTSILDKITKCKILQLVSLIRFIFSAQPFRCSLLSLI